MDEKIEHLSRAALVVILMFAVGLLVALIASALVPRGQEIRCFGISIAKKTAEEAEYHCVGIPFPVRTPRPSGP